MSRSFWPDPKRGRVDLFDRPWIAIGTTSEIRRF
jgi:hypothetical protein